MVDDNQSQTPNSRPPRPPSRATRALKESLLKDGKFLWSVCWRIGSVVVTVTVILIGIIGYSVKDFLNDSKARIQKQITNTEVVLTNRIHTSGIQISNLIITTFESSNVTLIVRNIAAERANHILETQVAPAVAKLTNEIDVFSKRIEGQQGKIEELNISLLKVHETESNLVTLIDSANRALKELNENTEFVTTVVRADHDDREAFGKLHQAMTQPISPFREAAWGVFKAIQTELFKPTTAWAVVPWERLDPLTNRATWKSGEIKGYWQQLSAPEAFDYVGFVWGHTNITKEQKLSFLRNVYLKDSRNSIRAADRAAELVAEELKAKYNPPMVFDSIETAWAAFFSTNRLFAASTNEITNTVYELFLNSDTNRVQVVRDWNEVKLLSFKTEFVPKEGSLRSLYCHSGVNAVEPIDRDEIQHFKNMYWAIFGGMSTGAVLKIELKYEKDTSSKAVQSMEVTTNAIIFDKTNIFTILPP
jgi:hypothetical protein